MPEIWAVIPAAGVGSRMQAQRPKQYLALAGKTVLEHCLAPFLAEDRITGLAVAVSPDDPYWQAPLTSKPLLVAEGGKERADSVLGALTLLSEQAADDAWVMVHDAARPCFSGAELTALCKKITAAELDEQGAILALPVADTLKRESQGAIDETLSRKGLWRALTPQLFPLGALRAALQNALSAGKVITDEASAMEAAGASPRLIQGRPSNIKITYPEDLALAELFLQTL